MIQTAGRLRTTFRIGRRLEWSVFAVLVSIGSLFVARPRLSGRIESALLGPLVSRAQISASSQVQDARPASPADDDAAAFSSPYTNGLPDHEGPAIDLWYGDLQTFGQHGRPQATVNILGNVSDPDGVSSVTYTLNGGSPRLLSLGPNRTRLVDRGDFNAEIDYALLSHGRNIVVLKAVDRLGNFNERTVAVQCGDGGPWRRSYTIDWGRAGRIQDVAQIVDGKWTIQPDGSVRTMQIGYDRMIALGDMSAWDSYDVLAEVTMHSHAWPGEFGVGLIAGWKGHTGQGQPRLGHPFQGVGWYSKFQAPGAFLNIYTNTLRLPEQILARDTTGRTLPLSVKSLFRFRVQRLNAWSSRYSLKVWPAGTPEPLYDDVTAEGEASTGSLVLGAHRADVSFGKIVVKGL